MHRVVAVAAVFATGCLLAPTFNGGDGNSDGGNGNGNGDGSNGNGDGGPPSSLRQTAYIKALNTAPIDAAGTDVALSGDGTTLAFGVPGADGQNTEEGSVYVYVRSGGDWTLGIALGPSEYAPGFGSALALSNDGTWLAVGARGTNDTGRVYMFRRDSTAWPQVASVSAPYPDDFDRFGYSVALSSDGRILVIGAPSEDSGLANDSSNDLAPQAGAVHVFTRMSTDGTSWLPSGYLKGPIITAGDRFGFDVAVSGDGTVIAVGAIAEGPTPPETGAVHLFTRGATWTFAQTVQASNATANYQFGNAVALSQDGATLLVGCLEESGGGSGITTVPPGGNVTRSGAAYWFTRSTTTWTQSHYIKASNAGAGDGFGTSVALASDGASFLIGAPGERSAATGIDGSQSDDTALDAGAAYRFTATSSALAQTAYVKASNTHASARFGSAVAISDDGKTIVIGAPEEDSVSSGLDADMTPAATTTNTGAVYVFEEVP